MGKISREQKDEKVRLSLGEKTIIFCYKCMNYEFLCSFECVWRGKGVMYAVCALCTVYCACCMCYE